MEENKFLSINFGGKEFNNIESLLKEIIDMNISNIKSNFPIAFECRFPENAEIILKEEIYHNIENDILSKSIAEISTDVYLKLKQKTIGDLLIDEDIRRLNILKEGISVNKHLTYQEFINVINMILVRDVLNRAKKIIKNNSEFEKYLEDQLFSTLDKIYYLVYDKLEFNFFLKLEDIEKRIEKKFNEKMEDNNLPILFR